MRWTLSVIILVSLISGHHDQARTKLQLTVIEPVGHSTSFRSVAVRAPHGLTIRYRFVCRKGPATMTVMIARQSAGYSPIGPKYFLARFQTVRAMQVHGAYVYKRSGYYRLNVSMPSRCSWTMRLFV